MTITEAYKILELAGCEFGGIYDDVVAIPEQTIRTDEVELALKLLYDEEGICESHFSLEETIKRGKHR